MDNYLDLLLKAEELLSKYEKEYEDKKEEKTKLEARREGLFQNTHISRIDKAACEKKLDILVKYPKLIKKSFGLVASISGIAFLILFAILFIINNGINVSEVLYIFFIAIGVSAVGSRSGFSPKDRAAAKKISKDYSVEELERLISSLSETISNNFLEVDSLNKDIDDINKELEEIRQSIMEVQGYIERIKSKREHCIDKINEELLNNYFREDNDMALIRERICSK